MFSIFALKLSYKVPYKLYSAAWSILKYEISVYSNGWYTEYKVNNICKYYLLII